MVERIAMNVIRPPADTAILHGARDTPGCASHAKRWVLVATVLGSSIVFIEGSAINIALPVIQESLGASVGQMQWISSTFTLLLASLILVAGSAGDRFGRRRLFVIGLLILTMGSLAAGYATTSWQLIATRAIQGLGGALLVPNSLALLSAAFPKAERGGAIGTWSAFTAITNAGGPIVGGLLVDVASWRAAFFLVVPLALVTLLTAARIPDVRIGRQREEIDWGGAIRATPGLTALLFGIIQLRNPTVAVPGLVLGFGLLVAFVRHERHTDAPMMPPRLFRSRTFLGANLMTLLLYFAVTGAFFLLPFDLIRVRHYSATATGAAFLPFALMMATLSRWTGHLADRYGARWPLMIGPMVTAAGFVLLSLLHEGSFATTVLGPMSLIGLGMALTVAPLTSTVMTAVEESEVGIASGVNNTVARFASLLAVAVVGLIAFEVFAHSLPERVSSLDLSPAVRDAVATRIRSLGEVDLPEGTSDSERIAIEEAVKDALSISVQTTIMLAGALAALAAIFAATLIESAPDRAAASEGAARVQCDHVGLVTPVTRRTQGCEECLRIGASWVHLRLCLSCGHVGCCDSSRHRHATAHFWSTNHPIVASLEPGETWRWCYLDDIPV
jgi:EmrB/QacA subfamily drug resistance transporter